MTAAMVVNELRCERHLHGVVDGLVIAVRCRWCSKATGREVVHRFDAATGVMLKDADGEQTQGNQRRDHNLHADHLKGQKQELIEGQAKTDDANLDRFARRLRHATLLTTEPIRSGVV